LPSVYQGVELRTKATRLYLADRTDGPRGAAPLARCAARLDAAALEPRAIRDRTRIGAVTSRVPMQMSVPEVCDLSREPQSVLDL
jgi:hypothetical protein